MQRITAIYVRRSVSDKDKGNNSLSIDAQKADCVNYLDKGEEYRIYCDDGKSAKDVEHRPAFQQMMSDAKDGLLGRIVVKKYDRFSRNLREYLNITNTLDSYNVSVYSLSEPFNTATKEGRMMRNNLLNFAEFERETIAARVADAYSTKAVETGLYQGGKIYCGYVPERRTIGGKPGSVLVPSEQAEVVKIAYSLYKNPDCSLQNILDYCFENNLPVNRETRNGMSNIDRTYFSKLLESPLYVRADKEVYQYLVSKGFEIIDGAENFDGIHGLFRHSRKGEPDYIKVGYHEGLIDSETWLAVQDRKAQNLRIPKGTTAKYSWVTGLAKCPHCSVSLALQRSYNVDKAKMWRYFRDMGAYREGDCIKKRLKTRPDDVENIVYTAMKERLKSIEIAKKKRSKPDSETEQLKTEVIRIDEEIRSKARKHKEIDTKPLTDPLSRWDMLTMEEKHALAITMIDVIYISDETGVDIQFSI